METSSQSADMDQERRSFEQEVEAAIAELLADWHDGELPADWHDEELINAALVHIELVEQGELLPCPVS
jgi:hypothetical protein